MDALFSLLTPQALVMAAVVTLLAGMVKGMVGFAMPMIMISGLSLFLPPEIALAALIVPTFITNGMQALRQGTRAALQAMGRFKLDLCCGLVFLVISAQLVRVVPSETLYLMIGLPVTGFALLNLSGWKPRLPARAHWVEATIGSFAGFVGGLSGVWGPPTVMFLTALDLPKQDHVRAQGVIYALGAFALFGAHIQSGVMRAETLPLSLAMVVPAFVGMLIGQRINDRIDQTAFRRATLLVLLLAGLNLVRRGFF